MVSGLKASVEHRKAVVLENLLQIAIGGKELLIRASEIREVVRPSVLTSVPMGPEHVIGLANIHGQIVCIIDVGGVSKLPACNREQTSRTRFLLLRHPVMHVAIWVDAVCSTRRLDTALLPGSAPMHDNVVKIECDGMSFDFLECSGLLS